MSIGFDISVNNVPQEMEQEVVELSLLKGDDMAMEVEPCYMEEEELAKQPCRNIKQQETMDELHGQETKQS